MSQPGDVLLEALKEPDAPSEDLRRRLLEALLPSPQARKMSYAEFLDWADEDTLAEWEDGEVVMSTPASRQHQAISGFLYQLLNTYVEVRRSGAAILPPFQMKLVNSGREPDLIFVANQNLGRLKETYLDGPADLVVEIISPESEGRDRGDKFYEYEKAGIPEYWLIDPRRERVEFYQLDARGQYHLIAPSAEGVYRSHILPDFWLRVSWLWQPPLVLDVLPELPLT